MMERQKAALQFFVSHQQLAKAAEPAMGHFHDPASCRMLWTLLALRDFLPSALNMRNIAFPFDHSLGWRSPIAIVRAQMLAAPPCGCRASSFLQGQHGFKLRHIMPIGCADDE